MKKFLLFTILLLSSIYQLFACGYSPYGEYIRYSLTQPTVFGYDPYHSFNYSANRYTYVSSNEPTTNVLDWYKYTNEQVEVVEIQKFMREVSFERMNKSSSNEFVKYLYENNKTNAIKYLKLAKKCESLNTWFVEEWERDTSFRELQDKGIQDLQQAIESESDSIFQRKYAFLLIRLNYYRGRKDNVKILFGQYFQNSERDYLYYWSLFFYTESFRIGNYMVNVANIFANSPEKTYASYHFFHKQWNKEKALSQTNIPEEIANIYAYEAVQKSSPALSNLEMIYQNAVNHPVLDFLLLRELSKLEDWIFTPYYTHYSPSTEKKYYNEDILLKRAENDRKYAGQVLKFVKSVDLEKVENNMLWEYVQVELLFMTRQFDECLQQVNSFQTKYTDEKCLQQIEQIKALCLVAIQENRNAVVTPEIQQIVLKYQKEKRFIFSLGRELEFKGNLLDGMALISVIHEQYEHYYYTDIPWCGTLLSDAHAPYFQDFFEYINYAYSIEKLTQLLTEIEKVEVSSDFEKLVYPQLISTKNYLGDLLGTKYIRENRLDEALLAFESVGQKYWDENYNAWERDRYSDGYEFKNNPFFVLKYTSSFIEKKDTFIVTKPSITKHLIHYLKLAENSEDQDYYYFLVANCYLNMTYEGNAWLMRRYYNSRHRNNAHIDYEEFSKNILAQKYYQKAYNAAKTDKFRALCLRMIEYSQNYNTISKKVKKQYPQYFDKLSGCIYFEEFFKARRNESM